MNTEVKHCSLINYVCITAGTSAYLCSLDSEHSSIKLTNQADIKHCFAKHSPTFNLLPVQQSAYRPFHSTETAAVSIHNDLVSITACRKVTLLVLLDLSMAFDTDDH